MPSIPLDKVNRFTLTKQHLTPSSKLNDILEITKDITGLHATMATTGHLSLLARMKRFRKEDLLKELEIRRLGKIRCVRRTVYALPEDMIPHVHNATKHLNTGRPDQFLKYFDITEKEYTSISKKILKAIPKEGMTAKEVKAAIKVDKHVTNIINIGILLSNHSQPIPFLTKTEMHYGMNSMQGCIPAMNISSLIWTFPVSIKPMR